MSVTDDRRDDSVVPLPRDPGAPVESAPPPSPHPRGHGAVVSMMSAFAVLGIIAMFAFITIGWPGRSSRYVMVVFVLSVVGFVACASMAVFTAARSTYAPEKQETPPEA